MVRLGLIILLLLCVTITGVYAAWTYAGTDDIADVYTEAKITISDAELSGANGTYTIKSNLILTVEPTADSSHTAMLVFTSNDSQDPDVEIRFKPAANAPQSIKDSAVPTQIYFGTTTPMQFEGKKDDQTAVYDILAFVNNTDNKLNIEWVKDGNEFVYRMEKSDLESQITLGATFVLDTKTKHDNFALALSGNVVIYVTDGKVTQ